MVSKLFDFNILDNTLGTYILISGIILLAISLKDYISRLIASLVFRIVKRIAYGVDRQSFVNLVAPPLENFFVILVTLIALEKLKYPALLNFSIYKVSLHRVIEIIAMIVMIASFIWLLLRIIDFIAIILEQKASMTESQTDNQLIVFFKDFFKVILVILGLLMILKFGFNFKITSLITGLSLAGAAVALATRESIENLIASFIIFFDRPFSTGDQIKVQNITGTVERIGLRSTRLRTTQKSYVTVPNKQMVDTIMDNISMQTQRRAIVQLEVSSHTTPQQIRQLITRIEGLMQQRKDRIENYSVFMSDIVKNSYVITVEFFTAPIPVVDFNSMRQFINISIIEVMEEMEIKLVSKEDVN
ncbi:MAG TPA: mechanosensitive ion channel domain-containing protein [Flavitalea sp.]|nr:mechanosensitive ion channel domain-containing protein [Flavitalea sp.]